MFKRHEEIYSREFFKFADHITLNDCFIVFRHKYEFIAHYDLDELLLPRRYNINEFSEKKHALTCSNTNYVCSKITPFENNNMYDYIKSLIESKRDKRNLDKLSLINFRRTITFKPQQIIEIKLINDLKNIIDNSIKFPTEIFVQTNHLQKYGHRFIIKREDIDYVRYLYKTYNSFFSCANNRYLRNITNINNVFVRYMFYHQNEQDYKGKKVYYYKNVYSVFTHWPLDYEKDTWNVVPSPDSGHLVQHYRDKHEVRSKNYTESIRNIGYDFEYIFLILKKFTNIC